MTRAELEAALPHIGWSLRPMSPLNPDGVPYFARLVNAEGAVTHIEVTPDRIELAGNSTAWGANASRTGSFGTMAFYFDQCRLDTLPGCVSIYLDGQGAFINLYNHEKNPDGQPSAAR